MTAVAQLPGFDQQVNDDRPTILELLTKAMQTVKPVGKEGVNKDQHYKFRAAEDVINHANVVFKKLGILVLPNVVSSELRDVKTSTGKASREATLRVTYRFIGPRGDYLDVPIESESMDFGDKSLSKAWTVALRTLLNQVLMLPTKDVDPDEVSYQRGSGRVDVAVDAAHREDDEPTRDELLDQVNEVWLALKKERGESEYAALDRMARFCQKWCRVDVIMKVSEDGAVEGVDLERLDDKKLTLVRNAMRNSLKELLATGQEA